MDYLTRIRSLFFAVLILFSACAGGSDDNGGTAGGAQTGTGNGGTIGDTVNPDIVPVSCAGITPDFTVEMQNLSFNPPIVNIENGDYVRWVNNDTVSHTVTSASPESGNAGGDFDSGVLGIGESVCFQFNTIANFTFFCRLHPEQMRDGVIVVRRSGNDNNDNNDDDRNDGDSNDDDGGNNSGPG